MITYITGDATQPLGRGNKIVAHVCNDIGAWGRGFVLSLSRQWPTAEKSYRDWSASKLSDDFPPFTLGNTVFVPVERTSDSDPAQTTIWVANMVAQHGISTGKDGMSTIRYDALEDCLQDVRMMAHDQDASVHMPRIGCGLGGGVWSEVEPIIERKLYDIEVYVYDYSSTDSASIPWNQ
jgi:O-acetyl-ADP-ribose deacetylase (regulator of RNase III)